MAGGILGPFPWEERFVNSLDIELIQRLLWPLLAVFIFLSFSDTLTTLLAFTNGKQFVELNPFAVRLFQRGYEGFIVAYAIKYAPFLPLFYIAGLGREGGRHDFQVRLLKFAGLVVLVGADIYLGFIVLGNNLPNLIRLLNS